MTNVKQLTATARTPPATAAGTAPLKRPTAPARRQHLRDRHLRRRRHPSESNYQLTLSGFQTNQSAVRTALRRRPSDRWRGVRLRRRGTGDPSRRLRRTERRLDLQRLHDVVQLRSVLRRRYDRPTAASSATTVRTTASSTPPPRAQGCTSTCKIADYCGDTVVDADEGEECDLGSANGTPGASCTAHCKIRSASTPPAVDLGTLRGFRTSRDGLGPAKLSTTLKLRIF